MIWLGIIAIVVAWVAFGIASTLWGWLHGALDPGRSIVLLWPVFWAVVAFDAVVRGAQELSRRFVKALGEWN